LGVLAALVVMGEDTAWGEFKLAAAWLIGGWLVLKDLLPALLALALKQQGGGVAHWAHIGGFLCGVSYAFLIGSKSEGQTEYLIEDARRSIDNKYAGNAIEDARKLIQKQPDNPAGYQLLAEANDIKNNENEALDNYELAIAKYLQLGDRQSAARVYLDALKKHPLFILQPREQIVLAGQMASEQNYQSAAENLSKIPFTFPDAPEGEISLLRSAQMYIDKLNQPDMGLHLLNTLLQRHPQTQWMAQVETAMQKAQEQLENPANAAPTVASLSGKSAKTSPKLSSTGTKLSDMKNKTSPKH
jgi:outer membrane protein assembly factor BamD (BamD/ComL family)